MMGNMLRDREQQYVATKDEVTQTWRILDTWHDELRSLGPEDDVPDDSEAITILTEGAFISLVKEASRIGVLQNASAASLSDEPDYGENITIIQEKDDRIGQYEREIEILKRKADESETFRIKEKALEAVLKLAAMTDVTSLSGE